MTWEVPFETVAGLGGLALATALSTPSGRSQRGSHQLSSCEICARQWWLRYDQQWVLTTDKDYRLRGSLMHLCLAYHYAAKMSQPPNWFYEKSLDAALEEMGKGSPSLINTAKQFLLAYRGEYQRDPWEPFLIEEEFTATIGELDPGGPDPSLDEERVSCRPDLLALAVDETGPFLWEYDHKSAGKNWELTPEGRWRPLRGLEKWKEEGNPFDLDWQVLVNLHILRVPSNRERLQNLSVRGFWIQRMTREPDADGRFYFDRHLLKIPARVYAETPRQLRRAVAKERALREALARGEPPAPNFWACSGRFGPCDYRPVCMAPTPEERLQVLNERYTHE